MVNKNDYSELQGLWLDHLGEMVKEAGQLQTTGKSIGVKKQGEILRCEARLVNLGLEFNARRPIILP